MNKTVNRILTGMLLTPFLIGLVWSGYQLFLFNPSVVQNDITYHLAQNRTVIYASESEKNKVIKYYEFFSGKQKQLNVRDNVQYEYFIDENNFIQYAYEYNQTGEKISKILFEPKTRYSQHKHKIEHIEPIGKGELNEKNINDRDNNI